MIMTVLFLDTVWAQGVMTSLSWQTSLQNKYVTNIACMIKQASVDRLYLLEGITWGALHSIVTIVLRQEIC